MNAGRAAAIILAKEVRAEFRARELKIKLRTMS